MKNFKSGFTLIELLIVIAIIGILAGVILVSTSSARIKAQKANAISSVKSVMPYTTECLSINDPILDPTAVTGGGPLCLNSTTEWPDITETACTYGVITPVDIDITVICAAGDFICTFDTGSCL